MAESPQQRSPGVLSRIGSWLSWGWGSPASSGDDPTSQTQQEEASDEDHVETGQPAGADETDSPALGLVPAETSPSLSRNAKHLTPGRGGGDGTRGRLKGHTKRTTETCRKNRRSRSFERRKAPEIFDQMGRRRSGRRRRSSHGDGGGAQAKSPTNPQPESPATTSLTSGPRTARADSAFEEAANSLPKASRAEAPSSGSREDVVRAEWMETRLSEDTDSPSSPESLVHATLVYSEMDEERVVRLTESSKSKRRSIKVSHSEVVFAKKVLVASEDQDEDQNVTFKDATDTKRLRSDERARFPEDRVDGASVKSKGRIADKISLFERGASSTVSSSTNLRRLDISPARHVASRLKDLTEPAGTRSSSVPPNQTVKERALNFSAGRRGEEKLTLPSGRTLNEGLSKTAEISSGRFEKTTVKTDTSREPKAKSKPHLNIDQADSKSHNATQSTSDSNIMNKEADSLPTVSSPTDETPQVKLPNRTGSRSKRRRGKDPLSPTKQEMGQGKQEVIDNNDKPLVDATDVIKTTEQYLKSTSDKESPSSAGEVVRKKPIVPPKLEKAVEIMQSAKNKSDSKKSPLVETKLPKEMKSKDEKERENSKSFETQIVATASDTHPPTSRKSSSNDEKVEWTDIDSRMEEKQKNINKKQPLQERSEGEQSEGQRNRDMIVNTLFGESGKPDPSVTKEEKPPSPEDVKEAKSKDSFETANSSISASRKDAMRNRGSMTDTLVLPEKDTKVENPPENDPKSAQRPNQKSLEKDCLTEITNQNQKNYYVTETVEASKHSNEGNTTKPTEEKVGGITTKTKQGKSKDISAVRQEDTTIMATSEGKETQTTEKNSSTKENTTSTTPNPALVKDQNDQMDAIISPQITPAEGGGLKRDGPPQKGQSESGEEQKTQTVSSKRDLQQPSADTKKGGTKTKSKITSTEMTSIVNGDIQSGDKILGFSLENTLPEIPSNNESLSLSSVKKKATSFSSKAIEASTEQSGHVSEKFTAKPASTDDTAFGLPASSDNKNTALSNSANEKTTPPPASPDAITTPAKPTTTEKTTSPQASTNEKTSTLPPSTNEKSTTLPATTTETISATPPDSNDEKTTSPVDSTNEITTPPPVSTPSESANKRKTNEKTTLPPASPNVITSHEKPTIIEKNTSLQASNNEKTSTLPASTKEKTTLPALTTETISASLGSSDDKNRPPPASTDEKNKTPSEPANKRSINEKTTLPPASPNVLTAHEKPTIIKKNTSPQASTNEKTSTLPASTKEKTTTPPASTIETISASLGSRDDKNKPPPTSTDEKTTSPLDSTKEITTPPPASTDEKTTPLPALTTKTVSASLGSSDDKNRPPPTSTDEKNTTPSESPNKRTTNEKTTLPPASPNVITTHEKPTIIEKNTSPQASTNETTSTLPVSTKQKTTTPPASTTETISASLDSNDDKNKPPPTSTDEKNMTPSESVNKWTTIEKNTSPQASTNEKTSTLPATTKEKTTTPPASTTETISASLGFRDDKNKPPPASTDEKTTSPLDSTKEITTPPPASTDEKTMPLPASTTKTISASLGSRDDKNKPPPASTDEKTTSPLDSTKEITTPPPASTDEKTMPLPASTTKTVSASLGSSDDKNKPPPASTDEKIAHSPASTNKTISALPGPVNEKTMSPIASANEKSTILPAPTSETTSTLLGSANKQTTHSASSTVKSTSTSLGSGDDKTTPPSNITNKMTNETPPASTNEKTTSSLDSASRKIKNEETKPPPATTNEKTKPSPASTNEKTTSSLDSASRKTKNEETIPPPASTDEKTNEMTTTPPASTKEKTTLAKSPTKENAGPPPASTSPSVSVDITSKNERTTPLPASSSFPITSSNGQNITPLPSSKEKIISPQDYESRKITPSPESINKKPSTPEVSAKAKISSSKSTDPSTRKKEFILKPFLLPQIPTAPGSSSHSRDSPSSWLDVDHRRPKKKKLLIPEPKLSSSVSETNLLNTSGEFDPDDFVANVKRLAMPFNLPQRKQNKYRLQAPPFAMPAIKEDRFEKPFDPEEFQHGLRRRREFVLDLAPSAISKSQDTEVKEVDIKPKRESILTRSLIFQRARKESEKEEEKKEEGSDEITTEPVKAKSRLERCSIVSMLRSPIKGRRMEFLSPTEGPSDGLFSPSDGSGSTAPTLSQLAPTTEPPKLIPVEETLAKNDSRGAQSGSQVILKPSKEIGLAVTPDLKTTSRDLTVTFLKDNNAPFPLSGTQTSSKVVPKPTMEDGHTPTPDLKATSLDPPVTMLTDTNAPSPSSGSQVVLQPTKDDRPAMKPDLKTTSRDPTVTMLTETNAPSPPNGSQTSSKVVPKPTKDDGPTLALDLKATPADPSVTMLTDTNAPSPSSGSQVVLQPTKDDRPAMKPDLKTTSRDPTVTMLTETNAPSPPNGSQTSQVVLKPTKDDGPTLTPELKTTSAAPPVTMLTDTNAPPPASSGSQNVLKTIKDDRPAMLPDLKTTSRDPTVTLLTDTNAPSPPNSSQTSSQKPAKNDGPTLTPELKTTSADPPVTMLTDTNARPMPSSGSQNVLKTIKDDRPAMKPDLKTTSRDPTVPMFTDTNAPPFLNGTQTGSGVVLVQPDGPTLKTTTVDPIVSKVTDANAPPLLPSFDDIKLPSFLEKFLPKEPENAQPSKKIDPLVARESTSHFPVDLNKAVDAADGKIPEVTTQIPQAKPQRELPNIPAAHGIHRRPAKIVVFEHHQFSGQSFEFYRDQPDATHMQLSSVISIKVVRGCWILYEKPGFEGRCIALEEEGVNELPNEWAEDGEESSAPVVIGSIRLAVRDYTPPRIELFTEPAGRGRSSEYVDDTEEVGSFSRPQNTGSIKVHSGLWLVYSDPGFQGLLAVLEAGEYPFPEDWGFPSPTVGSLRPLRMGALKVEKPNAVKAVLYEKAGLQGRCVEVQGDVFSFARTETDPSDSDNHGLNCVESLKILGGLWVGYDREGFDGQQFVLEEGEYLDWTDWGGTGEKLLSLRPVFMDFSAPHMKMFSELDFSERGSSIDLLEPLDNTANTRYGPQTHSIEVLAGVWVAFEDAGFSGQQFVLEKGLYGSPEDWGASHSRICSAFPVILENLENSCHFQIELFSESGFGGKSVLLQDSLPTIPSGFIVRSCRVHAGSWLAFSGECFSSHQCVLEEGFYPDLRTMGFTKPDVSVLSLQPTGLELSVPSVVLFERSGLRGRRTVLKTSSVNLQLTHSCSRVSSVLVLGGMWVLYEDHNFRGSQFLLNPGAFPDWLKLSSWLRIGSLRPLMQKQVHFRLRNKELGLLMSVIGSSEEIKLMRIQVSEETGGAEQIWTYQDGHLHCKCLLDVCLDVSSGVLMSGSRAVLSAEPGKPQQLWNIMRDGIIRSNAKPDLVLEVKGGQQFDKHQIIVNEFHPDKVNQRWSLEIL